MGVFDDIQAGLGKGFDAAMDAAGKGFDAAASATNKALVTRAPFIQAFIHLCDDGWLQGWHERNGGNLTYRMTEEDVAKVRGGFDSEPREWVDLGFSEPTLANAYFLITGSGAYMHNVSASPIENIGIVEMNEAGSAYRVVWGLMNRKPTSELPTHIMNHAIRMKATDGACRVIYHAHPNNIIAMTFVEPLDARTFSRALWKAMTECVVVFPEGVGVVGLHNVWSLGRVARTGLPLIESVITLGSYTHSGNYIVKEGSMLGELLEFAHIKLNSGDTLVRGGPLRGESIDRLDRSITKGATGVFVVEAGTVPPMEGHSPCINCGACVLICPARLSPSMLSRNAEFALHERCRDEHVDCCLECGLCGYVCIARRPVLQYIRLAKHKLAQADEARRLKERELRPAAQPAAEAKEGEN